MHDRLRCGVAMLGLVALIVGLGGCDDGPSRPRSIVDVYVLQTVDGKPLPYEYPDSPVRHGLTAERITLFDDRTFTDYMETFEGPVGAERAFNSTSSGRYSRLSGRLRLEYPPSEWIITTVDGTLNGQELTIGCVGFFGPSCVFRKEP